MKIEGMHYQGTGVAWPLSLYHTGALKGSTTCGKVFKSKNSVIPEIPPKSGLDIGRFTSKPEYRVHERLRCVQGPV